jgi:hypothetical protein
MYDEENLTQAAQWIYLGKISVDEVSLDTEVTTD